MLTVLHLQKFITSIHGFVIRVYTYRKVFKVKRNLLVESYLVLHFLKSVKTEKTTGRVELKGM